MGGRVSTTWRLSTLRREYSSRERRLLRILDVAATDGRHLWGSYLFLVVLSGMRDYGTFGDVDCMVMLAPNVLEEAPLS